MIGLPFSCCQVCLSWKISYFPLVKGVWDKKNDILFSVQLYVSSTFHNIEFDNIKSQGFILRPPEIIFFTLKYGIQQDSW